MRDFVDMVERDEFDDFISSVVQQAGRSIKIKEVLTAAEALRPDNVEDFKVRRSVWRLIDRHIISLEFDRSLLFVSADDSPS